MWKTILLFILFFSIFSGYSQVIEIEYTSNSLEGGVCIKERHIVTLTGNTYSRLDLYDNSLISEYIELNATGYDDAGLYWETWSPIIPENVTRENVEKVTSNRRMIKVYYLSRKNDVMNITEVLILKNRNNRYRYFFTDLAAGILCEQY